MQTTIIDQLFLELSQFTQATTHKEHKALTELAHFKEIVSQNKIPQDLTVEDVLKQLIDDAGYAEVKCILDLLDNRYRVDCCNEECRWTGYNTDCSVQPHSPDNLLCPECHENTEPVAE
ncbi:MAG: hypothetical protein HGB26_01450 [Desulfobulbaceae bacterium]|nr:hypothetical protein [Desulfobulbaceae bacterium]